MEKPNAPVSFLFAGNGNKSQSNGVLLAVEPKVQEPGEPASQFGIKQTLLDERRLFAPPIRPPIQKGSVVIRDLRLWHAGIPSRFPNPRTMLAFVHTARWYECPTKVLFPESARLLVEERWAKQKHPAMYHAHFVADGLDHPPFTPNFDFDNVAFQALLPKIEKENGRWGWLLFGWFGKLCVEEGMGLFPRSRTVLHLF